MKVKDCMCNNVFCIKPDTTVREAAKLMLNKHIGSIPICDTNNKILGIVTDRDLVLRSIANDKDTNTTKVEEIMTKRVYKVSPEHDVQDANRIMCDCQVRRVPVVENEKVVGIITVGDLANNNKINQDDVGNTIERICNCNGDIQNAQ